MNRKLWIVVIAFVLTCVLVVGGLFLFPATNADTYFKQGSCFWLKQIYALFMVWGACGFCLFYRPKNVAYMAGAVPVLYSAHLLYSLLMALGLLGVSIFVPDLPVINVVHMVVQVLIWVWFGVKCVLFDVQKQIQQENIVLLSDDTKTPSEIAREIKGLEAIQTLSPEVRASLKSLREYLSYSVPTTKRVVSHPQYSVLLNRISGLRGAEITCDALREIRTLCETIVNETRL